RAGRINLCRNRRFLGGNVHGAMAEALNVPMSNLVPLPESLDYVHASLTEPLAVALHAVRQAGDLRGKTILIAGCGPIGLLTLVMAQQAAVAQIIMTDVVPARLQRARELGADAAFNPTDTAWHDQLREFLNTEQAEVDVAFDAVGVQA